MIKQDGFKDNKMSDVKKVPFLELELINSNYLDEVSFKFRDGRLIAYRACSGGKIGNEVFIDTKAPKEKIIILRLE